MNDFDVIQANEMAFCAMWDMVQATPDGNWDMDDMRDVPAESNADFNWDFGGEDDLEYSYSECEDGYLDTYWESLTEY